MDEAAELAGAQTVGGRNYGDNMPDANTRIDSLKEDIREIGYSILDLQAKAKTHDTKLDQVLATLGAHRAQFDAIDSQLTTHEGRFDRIDSQLTTHDNRFDRIDGQLAEILSRLPAAPA